MASTSEDEKPQPSPTIFHKMAAEFIGTFIFVFIGIGSIFVNQRTNITLLGIALAVGGVLTSLVYAFGHVSGCHLNPAVTIAFAAVRKFLWKEVPLYVISQVVGATLACLMLRWLFDDEQASLMLSLPVGKTSNLSAVACETICTFIFVLVICGSATDAMAVKEMAGVAIGIAMFFTVLIGGTISGASMNPARSIGAAIATMKFRNTWIYIISPVIGAVTASTLYNFLRTPEPMKKNTLKSSKQPVQPDGDADLSSHLAIP